MDNEEQVISLITTAAGNVHIFTKKKLIAKLYEF